MLKRVAVQGTFFKVSVPVAALNSTKQINWKHTLTEFVFKWARLFIIVSAIITLTTTSYQFLCKYTLSQWAQNAAADDVDKQKTANETTPKM